MAKSPRRPSDNNLIPPINQQTISDFLQSFVPRLSRRRGRGKIKFSRSRIIYVVVFSLSGEKLLKRSPMGQFSDKVESDFGFLPFLILLTPYVCFEVVPKIVLHYSVFRKYKIEFSKFQKRTVFSLNWDG